MHKDSNVLFLKILLGAILQSTGKWISIESSRKEKNISVCDIPNKCNQQQQKKMVIQTASNAAFKAKLLNETKIPEYLIMINNEIHEDIIILTLCTQNNSDKLLRS